MYFIIILFCILSPIGLPPLAHGEDIAPSNLPIVGGSELKIKSVPYVVALLRNDTSLLCGGVILSANVILTAGHCVVAHTANPLALSILAGYNTLGLSMQRLLVGRIVVHPKFQRGVTVTDGARLEAVLDYDFAVLVLHGRLHLDEFVQPIALAEHDATANDTLFLTMGWGLTTTNVEVSAGMGARLNGAYIPKYDRKRCVANYKSIRVLISDRMICVGYEEGNVDVCHGDSGGPLVFNDTLYGIVSFGHGCALPDYPGVFANVTAERNWILGTMSKSRGFVYSGGTELGPLAWSIVAVIVLVWLWGE